MRRLAEIIRRFFVVVLWLVGLTIATSSSFYFASIATVAGGEGETVVRFTVGAIIFLTFVGITYFIHKKILNYIFMVDTEKTNEKKPAPE